MILRCNSLIYGPKSGSLSASIPGAPPPPPGLPVLPVPPLPLLPREPALEPPVDGESDGRGAPEPLPFELPALEPPLGAPVGAEVPPIGPVERVLPAGALDGRGVVNGELGLSIPEGAETGLALGLALGGAGLAGDGLFVADG